MAGVLDPQLKRALAERVRYYNELGIYDFYRREPTEGSFSATQAAVIQPEEQEEMTPRAKTATVVPETDLLEVVDSKRESGVADSAQALRLIREDLGDCTRCRLSKQ